MAKGDKGWNKVFSDGSGGCKYNFTKPNEVYIDGQNQSIIQSFYQFYKEETYVKLIWKNPVKNCESMFCGCSHILEMNLTYFNTSQLISMYKMFQYCLMLTSIEMSNIDTSNVLDMGRMFQNCISLNSLDLSSFDISKNTNIGTIFF